MEGFVKVKWGKRQALTRGLCQTGPCWDLMKCVWPQLWQAVGSRVAMCGGIVFDERTRRI